LLLLLLLVLIVGAIETRGQMSIRVELARRLAMQLGLVTLRMRRATRRGVVVIHVGLLKTHDVDRRTRSKEENSTKKEFRVVGGT
jgi:hypothetical protein